MFFMNVFSRSLFISCYFTLCSAGAVFLPEGFCSVFVLDWFIEKICHSCTWYILYCVIMPFIEFITYLHHLLIYASLLLGINMNNMQYVHCWSSTLSNLIV